MVIFIKVSPHVAKTLNLDDVRTRTSDGNYLLWPRDLSLLDRAWLLHQDETMARIGGVILTDPQAAAEQQGSLSTPLPEATDPLFRAPEMEENEAEPVQSDTAGLPDDDNDDTLKSI